LKAWEALRAFRGLLETPRRVKVVGAVSGKLAFVAGLSTDGQRATLMLSSFADTRTNFTIRWTGFTNASDMTAEIHIVDADHEFLSLRSVAVRAESDSLHLSLKAPAIALIRLGCSRR